MTDSQLVEGCLAAVSQGFGVEFVRRFVAFQCKHLKDFGGIFHALDQFV